MTEYSFYNCIRYRNAKTRQSIWSNYEVFCKDANCVANANTTTQLKLICQIYDFMYESQQNFTI